MTNTPKPEALKPCPFCDSMDVDLIEQDDREFFLIGCLSCWTQGPSKLTEAEAIAVWSTRASDTLEADVAALRDALSMVEYQLTLKGSKKSALASLIRTTLERTAR